MKHQKIFGLFLAIVIAIVLTVSALVVVLPASATPDNPPNQVYYNHVAYTILSVNGITNVAAGTGVGYRFGGFGFSDCFGNLTIALAQTVTLGLQASADNAAWTSVLSFTAASVSSVVYTRTNIYGEYLRAVASPVGANPFTLTVKCTLKN
jgi:hypothetical protein